MKILTNFPLFDECWDAYGSMAQVQAACAETGLDGLEVIWDHRPYTKEMPAPGQAPGYHLVFWSHWLDFWLGNEQALMQEYGSWEMVQEYYHSTDPHILVERYRTDLQHALDVGAEYVVFHVSDVSLEECFTYRFAHSDQEVIDAAADLINQVFDGQDYPFALLCENLWWPGLTFTDPRMTQRLMDSIAHPDKGIMLDIGHLLHTNNALRTQEQGAEYVQEMLDRHGKAADYVRALHLHQSLTGSYVQGNRFRTSQAFEQATGYWDKYGRCYDHVVEIDRHQPWESPAIAPVINGIAPEWINNELSAYGLQGHFDAVRTQMQTLEQGGLRR